MTLEEKMAIAKSAGKILASVWKEKVDAGDAIQEAVVVALEKPEGWWDKHTRSYLVATVKANIWARLIRRRYFRQEGPSRKLVRVHEYPVGLDPIEQRVAVLSVATPMHLGGWT